MIIVISEIIYYKRVIFRRCEGYLQSVGPAIPVNRPGLLSIPGSGTRAGQWNKRRGSGAVLHWYCQSSWTPSRMDQCVTVTCSH